MLLPSLKSVNVAVDRTEEEVLLELGQLLYPAHKTLIQQAFLALEEADAATVKASLDGITSLLGNSSAVRPGLLGRFVFPSPMAIAQNLQLQLETRFARQSLVGELQRDSSVAVATQLVEQYFDKLLAWNEATGWAKMLNIVRGWPSFPPAPRESLALRLIALEMLITLARERKQFAFARLQPTQQALYADDLAPADLQVRRGLGDGNLQPQRSPGRGSAVHALRAGFRFLRGDRRSAVGQVRRGRGDDRLRRAIQDRGDPGGGQRPGPRLSGRGRCSSGYHCTVVCSSARSAAACLTFSFFQC